MPGLSGPVAALPQATWSPVREPISALGGGRSSGLARCTQPPPTQPGQPAPSPWSFPSRVQTCHGSGVEMKLRALGPGMVQQIQQRCSRCGGGGYSCPASDRCTSCDGKGLAPEKKVFEVRLRSATPLLVSGGAPAQHASSVTSRHLPCAPKALSVPTSSSRSALATTPTSNHMQVHVEPGHRHGSKVVFRGEAGSDSPDVLPGDLIFILEQVRPAARLIPSACPRLPVSALVSAWLPPAAVGTCYVIQRAALLFLLSSRASRLPPAPCHSRRRTTPPSSASAPTCSSRSRSAWWRRCAVRAGPCCC